MLGSNQLGLWINNRFIVDENKNVIFVVKVMFIINEEAAYQVSSRSVR